MTNSTLTIDAVTSEVEISDEEIAVAQKRALESSVGDAHAIAARTNQRGDELIVTLRGGLTLTIPTHLLQGVAGADPQLIARVELLGAGSGLHWEELDADFGVQDLVAGSFGTRRWMSQLEERGLLDDASIVRRQVDALLGVGEITKPGSIQANHFTATAREKIEAAGGTAEVI